MAGTSVKRRYPRTKAPRSAGGAWKTAEDREGSHVGAMAMGGGVHPDQEAGKSWHHDSDADRDSARKCTNPRQCAERYRRRRHGRPDHLNGIGRPRKTGPPDEGAVGQREAVI